MDDFTLRVFHRGYEAPTEIVACRSAADLLAAIPPLLGKHPDCWVIAVYAAHAKLFSVDCTGSAIYDSQAEVMGDRAA